MWNFVSKVSGFQFLSFSDFKKNLLSVDFFFLPLQTINGVRHGLNREWGANP